MKVFLENIASTWMLLVIGAVIGIVTIMFRYRNEWMLKRKPKQLNLEFNEKRHITVHWFIRLSVITTLSICLLVVVVHDCSVANGQIRKANKKIPFTKSEEWKTLQPAIWCTDNYQNLYVRTDSVTYHYILFKKEKVAK